MSCGSTTNNRISTEMEADLIVSDICCVKTLLSTRHLPTDAISDRVGNCWFECQPNEINHLTNVCLSLLRFTLALIGLESQIAAQYQYNIIEWDIRLWCQWHGLRVGHRYNVAINVHGHEAIFAMSCYLICFRWFQHILWRWYESQVHYFLVVPDGVAEWLEHPRLLCWNIRESEPYGFEPWSSKTNYFKVDTCCFLA